MCGFFNLLSPQAFPCISTGVYGYPNTSACCVALRTTRKFLEDNHEVENLIERFPNIYYHLESGQSYILPVYES